MSHSLVARRHGVAWAVDSPTTTAAVVLLFSLALLFGKGGHDGSHVGRLVQFRIGQVASIANNTANPANSQAGQEAAPILDKLTKVDYTIIRYINSTRWSIASVHKTSLL